MALAALREVLFGLFVDWAKLPDAFAQLADAVFEDHGVDRRTTTHGRWFVAGRGLGLEPRGGLAGLRNFFLCVRFQLSKADLTVLQGPEPFLLESRLERLELLCPERYG